MADSRAPERPLCAGGAHKPPALIKHSAGARKKAAQAIGRSRGGPSTKIQALADALANPCALMLTPGQDHDLACAEPLLENTNPGAVMADKAYDADTLIGKLTHRGVTPVIPPKANRKTKRECDFALYCERNLIERFFNKTKHFAALRRATTNLRETISPQFSWSPQSSCSTEDRP